MKRLLAAATLAIGAFPLTARAADAPRVDVFAGYSLRKTDGESRHGWEASLGWNLRGRLGVVADVSGHYKDEFDDLSYMGGLRYALHGEKLTPFVHALAGGIRDGSSIHVLGVTISERKNYFAWAAGGGLSYRISDRFDARVQADYFNVRIEGTNDGNPRFAAGVAYRFGRK
jgi:opacity protein-like surface antigen